jgi:hypothetical protein
LAEASKLDDGAMLRFFHYVACPFFAPHCSVLFVRRALSTCPSLTRFEVHVNISFFLSIRNGIRHDSFYHRTSQDAA